MNYGFNVKITFKKSSPFGRAQEIYHNVTEIHYNYQSISELGVRVAFESDIHATGITQSVDYIQEFEAKVATKKHKEF